MYEQYGFWGNNGAFASLFSGKKQNNILSSETLKQFDEFKDKFNSSTLSAEALAEQIENVDQRIIDYAKTCKNGEMTTKGFKESIDTMSLSAKAGEVALNALRVAGSMFATWAIAKGLELAVNGIDELAHSVEHCKERVDELMSNYQSALDKANDNAKTVENLASRYEELSKGVNNLGENVSLTADEYSEYNDIVNQIAKMFPTLIQGYTNEGNAILSLKGNVEQLRDAYKEAQQEAYNMLIISGKDSDGNDIIKNWENLHGTDFFTKLFDLGADDVGGNISTQDAIKQLEALFNMSAETYRNIEKITGSGTREQIASLTDIEKEIGYGSFLYKALGIDGDVTDEAFAEARKQAQGLIKTYQAEIDYGLNSVQTLANAYLMTNEDYDKFDEQSKTAASLLVNSIDEEIANGFSSKADVGSYVIGIVDSIKDNQEVQDALISLLSLDTSKMSIKDAQDEINKYIAIIAAYLDEKPVDLKLRLGVDIQQDKKELRDKLSHGGQDLVIDDWIDTLTVDEVKLANSTAFDEALERQKQGLDDAALSAENYSAALDEVKASQDGIGKKTGISPLSITETIDQLNTRLKPAIDSLKSAWQDMFDDDGKFDLKSVDILSTCDSIKSKLDEMSDPEGLNLDVDYSSFEDFVRVLSNTESTQQDVEKAMDSLSDSITEAALSGAEDFETMKATLENSGIENSSLVAFDALASNTDMLEQALDEANVSMDDFIVNAKDGSVEATKAGQAFLKEKVGAENYAEALNILAFHKELCNLQKMNTAGEVANLKTLAENAGYTGEVIQYLTELEQIYQEVASGTLTAGQLVAKVGRAAILKGMIDNAASKVQYAPKVDWSGAVKDAGKAGKDSGKSYKDKLKEELSDLESVISGITGRIDDQISSINEQKSAALESIDAQKEALESAKESAVEALEAERDARLEVIETQKAQLEEQIKLIDKQIKQKQDEIDAINETASARERELNLQRAQFELEKMQNMRTKLVKIKCLTL